MNKHQIIEKLRPTDLSVAAPDWDRRQAEIWREVADRTITPEPPGQPARIRRRTALRMSIAATAALLVAGVAPVLLPSGSPEARAQLELLAESARTARPLSVGPGQYLYVVTDQEQEDPNNPHQGLVNRHEIWIAQDGSTVIRMNDAPGLEPEVHGPYPLEDTPTSWDKNAEMPRDSAALERWLRARVSGSMTQDEAIFVALTDMLRVNNPDPELRAVMIETLPRISHVKAETGQQDSLGRPAVVISRAEPLRLGRRDYVYFSPDTGQYLEQRSSLRHGGFYRGIRVEERIVDSRPG